MSPSSPAYVRPTSLDDLLHQVAQPGTAILSGGTDFYPARLGRTSAETTVLDISGIAELRTIARNPAGWRFGAATTWTDIARATQLPAAFDVLRAAALRIGGVQIQNAATIAGNLCTASPAADGMPALLVLDASVELRSSDGLRVLPVHEFVVGYRRTALRPGEIVSAILVPEPPAGAVSAFAKFGSRAYLVISIAMVGVLLVVHDGVISEARIAVGACSAVAQRLVGLEAALVGAPWTSPGVEAAVLAAPIDELTPIDDVRGSARYRSTLVPRLILDALAMCEPAP